jgi:hypothetical protein
MPYILFVKCFKMTVIGNFGVTAGYQTNIDQRKLKFRLSVVTC